MKKARFELDFEVEAHLEIGREMEATLHDGSRIIFHESEGVNHGAISFEIDQPDQSIARDEGRKRIELFFNCMLLTSENMEDVGPISYPRKPILLNPDDFKGVPKRFYEELKVVMQIAGQLEQQKLEAASKTLAKIDGLSQDKQDIMLRSLRWFSV